MSVAPDVTATRPHLTRQVEAGTDDAVTTHRRELKFPFDRADVGKLSALLEANARRVVFGAKVVSSVASIYFDDERFTAVHQSLAGVARRTKVRLRWYDEPMAHGDLFFEVKHRRGLDIHKRRVPLRTSAPLDTWRYRDLTTGLAELLDDDQAAMLAAGPEPTVLVAYRRQHFRDPESDVRLTLDYDIVGCDQLGLLRPARRFGVPLHDLAVLEVKAPPTRLDAVPRLLFPLKPRLLRSSKYVQCCLQMDWWTVE